MLQIILDTQRLGQIDVSEQISRLRFTTRLPEGFSTASVVLNAPRYRLLSITESDVRGHLYIYGRGQLVWTGTLSSPALASGGQRLSFDAEGPGLQLRDRELWAIYADADYTRWRAEVSDRFSTDNNNRLYIGSSGGVSYNVGDYGVVRYPDNGVEVGEDGLAAFSAHVEVAIESGDWVAEIKADGNVIWSRSESGSWDIELLLDPPAQSLGLYLRATSSGEGIAHVRATEVVVRGLPSPTPTAIVRAILAMASIHAFDVRESALRVDKAWYQGASRLRAIEEMAQLGDGNESWVAAIYERGGIFRPWGDATWMLTPEDLREGTIKWDRAAVRNAVRAELPDGWRSDWLLDEASVQRWGRRDRTLRLPWTSREEAIRRARLYLNDHAFPVASLRLRSNGFIHRPDGSGRWPAYFVRAGDVIIVRDLLPDRDLTLRVQETHCDGQTVDIAPVGAPQRLEQLLAVIASQR